MQKTQHLQEMVLLKLDDYMQTVKLDPPSIKLKSKATEDLNIRADVLIFMSDRMILLNTIICLVERLMSCICYHFSSCGSVGQQRPSKLYRSFLLHLFTFTELEGKFLLLKILQIFNIDHGKIKVASNRKRYHQCLSCIVLEESIIYQRRKRVISSLNHF